jgi:hypothetical protein
LPSISKWTKRLSAAGGLAGRPAKQYNAPLFRYKLSESRIEILWIQFSKTFDPNFDPKDSFASKTILAGESMHEISQLDRQRVRKDENLPSQT